MNKKNNYIWIFGENLGETARNNLFYFWKHIVNQKEDSISKYIILKRNKENKKIYKALNKIERKSLVWKNSLKHLLLYMQSDMQFVAVNHKDVSPERFLFLKFKFNSKKPLIYLENEQFLINTNNYNDTNIFRFIYYDKDIKNKLVENNIFKDYQLNYGEFLPKYKELIIRNKKEENQEKKQIFWFLVLRNYNKNSCENRFIRKTINVVLKNKELNTYLEQNNLKLKVCIPQLYKHRLNKILENVNCKNIEVVFETQIDIIDEVIKSKMLITDYSSLGFDFTLLNKPVILYQPDKNTYLRERVTYYNLNELKTYSMESLKDLIETITQEKYEINKFYRERLPQVLDYKYIEEGKYIDKLYNNLKDIQENKITFLGFNYYTIGGTVSATRSLAEALIEKGKMVELLSLRKTRKLTNLPNAMNISEIYDTESRNILKRILNRLKECIWKNKKNFSYLKYDVSSKYMKPFVGYELRKKLNNIRSNTVVSTRETFHLFVEEAKSKKIKNKIYFFHTPTDMIEDVFQGMLEEIKKVRLNKTVFVTENNKNEYITKHNYSNYNNSLVLGNALESKNIIDIDEIKEIEEKEEYCGIYLVRISKERINDINNLIGFGKYLKENNIPNIKIDIFGDGDYVEEFISILIENNLNGTINYKGQTENPAKEIRKHDAVVDFSTNHSFGMTYLEGILNGKMVYCMKNTGSTEVMNEISEAFINSYDDLIEKMNNLPKITKEQLQDNYRKIQKRFSREVLAEKFLKYIEKD